MTASFFEKLMLVVYVSSLCLVRIPEVSTWGGLDLAIFRVLGVRQNSHINKDRLDLAVLFTPSTPNRQNRNQVRWNICAGVRLSTPSFKVV